MTTTMIPLRTTPAAINYLQAVGPIRCAMPKPETGLKWFEARTPEQECGWIGGGPGKEEEFYEHALKVHGVDFHPQWSFTPIPPNEPREPGTL